MTKLKDEKQGVDLKNTLCPYKNKPVNGLETNREHIVPDALGGPNGFALRADSQTNSDFGSTADLKLINAPMIAMLASKHGIETRSGESELRARGALAADGSVVEVTLRKDSADFRSRVPVIKDDDGRLIGVRGFGDDAQRELERVTKGYAKKGMAVVPDVPVQGDSMIKVQLAHNLSEVAQGLGKIAYLATIWTLGDAVTSSAAGALYRNWINAPATVPGLQATGMRVIPAQELPLIDTDVELTERNHLITVTAGGDHVVTTVKLFNQDLFSLGFIVEIPELGNKGATTRIIVIDAVGKTFTEKDEHLPQELLGEI